MTPADRRLHRRQRAGLSSGRHWVGYQSLQDTIQPVPGDCLCWSRTPDDIWECRRPSEGLLGTHRRRAVNRGASGQPSLLTTDEVAAMLGTGPRFVQRLVTERRIPFINIGRHVRFAESDVTEFIEAGRVHAFYRVPTRGW